MAVAFVIVRPLADDVTQLFRADPYLSFLEESQKEHYWRYVKTHVKELCSGIKPPYYPEEDVFATYDELLNASLNAPFYKQHQQVFLPSISEMLSKQSQSQEDINNKIDQMKQQQRQKKNDTKTPSSRVMNIPLDVDGITELVFQKSTL